MGELTEAMKIAYLADAPVPSQFANAVQVLHMSAAMAGLGHDVRLVSPWHPERARTTQELDDLHRQFALPKRVRLVYLPHLDVRGRLRASYFYLAVAYACAIGAKLVYTRSPRIARLAGRLGMQVVFEAHNPPNSPAGWRAVRFLATHPRVLLVFISQRLREIYEAEVPLSGARSLVEHDAVDEVRFADEAMTAVQARAALGKPTDGRWIVHVGHLYEGRGAEILLDVLQGISNARLVFVGGRPKDVARVRARAEAQGLAHRVELVGHRPVSELPLWLWAADVLALPYTSQTVTSDGKTRHGEYASPMKLFEYLAAGRPIVASNFPSMAEVLRDGDNALLVKPDDPVAFQAGLMRVFDDAALAEALAARARKDSVLYTWSARARRILDASRALSPGARIPLCCAVKNRNR